MMSFVFFCATFATAMIMSFVFLQFSSVLFARKRAVAAMFCSGKFVSPGSLHFDFAVPCRDRGRWTGG
jgi:hypothetical protein